MGMATPRESRRWFLDGSGETYVWKSPMHCLLLTGYDGDTAVFSDPLAEAVTRYPLADAEFSVRGMGMQAVTVRRLK